MAQVGKLGTSMADGSTSSAEMHLFYTNVLKEMSEQVGDICRDLQSSLCQDFDIQSCTSGYMEPFERKRPIDIVLVVRNLEAALRAAERRVEEEVNINAKLKDKMNATRNQLLKVAKDHAEELKRKEQTMEIMEQLNIQTANQLSLTESGLEELQERSARQIRDAEDEIRSLRSAISTFKLDCESIRRAISVLVQTEKDKQIQDATEQIQIERRKFQNLAASIQNDMEQNFEVLAKLKEIQVEAQGTEHLIMTLQTAGQEKEIQFEQLSETVTTLTTAGQEKESLLKQLSETILALTTAGREKELQLKQLSETILALTTAGQEKELQLEQLKKTILVLTTAGQEKELQLEQLKKTILVLTTAGQEKELQLEQLKKTILVLTTAGPEKELQLEQLKNTIMALTTEAQEKDLQLEHFSETITALTRASQEKELHLEQLNEIIMELTTAGQEKEFQLEQLSETIVTLTSAGEEKELQLVQLKERLQALEAETNQREQSEREKDQIIQDLTERVQKFEEENLSCKDLVTNLSTAGLEKDVRVQELMKQLEELTKNMDAYEREIERTQGLVMDLRRATEQKDLVAQDLLNRNEVITMKIGAQQQRVSELLQINEELIQFGQCKENEVHCLREEYARLGELLRVKANEVGTICLGELMEAKKDDERLKQLCADLQSKLTAKEYELLAREDALHRLTQQLAACIEEHGLLQEQKDKLLQYLTNAQFKEHRMDDERRQMNAINQNLGGKISNLEAELNHTVHDLSARGEYIHVLEREMARLRARVRDPKEEVTIKEANDSDSTF